MRRSPLTTLAVALAAAPLVATTLSAPATAAAAPGDPVVMLDRLVGPLKVAVSGAGTAFVSQNFAGLLTKKAPGQQAKTLFAADKPNTEVGGVSVHNGVVTFTTTKGKVGKVMKRTKQGKIREVANIWLHEKANNPDGGNDYGFQGLSDECLEDVPDFLHPYSGIKESHPYATERVGAVTYVADAAANVIFKVAADGTVSTAGVLPPIPVEITDEQAEALGLPDCVVGETLLLEPVPTDVERGPDGLLYVTSLPGGPEDGSLGANGSVFTVDPSDASAEQIVTGLVSPTGLAVTNTGDLLVAQLFDNSIVGIEAGSTTPEPYRRVNQPGDVEWTRQAVYVTTKVLSNNRGKLTRFPLP